MDALKIDLPSSLDIAMITSYFEGISQTVADMSDNSSLVIDAKELSIIDTAGLQLCAALFLELSRRNISISWANQSEDLVDNAKHLGLSQILHLT